MVLIAFANIDGKPRGSAPSPEDGFIPGTVHLVDLEGTMHARHAEGGQRDVVLVPTPSGDPDDPVGTFPDVTLCTSVSRQH